MVVIVESVDINGVLQTAESPRPVGKWCGKLEAFLVNGSEVVPVRLQFGKTKKQIGVRIHTQDFLNLSIKL